MISIHLKSRLELKNNHVIHSVVNNLYSQPTVPVQWLKWKKNSQGLHILAKNIVCMMNICHIQINLDKVNSRGESLDVLVKS